MKTRALAPIVVALFATLIFSSCNTTTEEYARKEYGKEFGVWKLTYDADYCSVYWPSLELINDINGELTRIDYVRDWWTRNEIRRDTTKADVKLGIEINNVKSKSDAQYYNSIKFHLSDLRGMYAKHTFTFNDGQADSLSFSVAVDTDDHFFYPGREMSGKIISLLNKNKTVNLKVSYNNREDGTDDYVFTIEGTKVLDQALSLLHKRKELAYEESKKQNYLDLL